MKKNQEWSFTFTEKSTHETGDVDLAPAARPVFDINIGCFSRNSIPVLNALNFSAQPGKWLSILGRSGIGKTTLLRLLAGLEGTPPLDPEISVAYMSQSDALFPWSTVYENAALGFRLRGQSAPKERILQALHQVGLDHYEHSYPHQLSTGMRQRVALARTWVEDRQLILLDEPFSSLDALTRMQMQELAWRIFADKAIIFVTHDPWEALRMSHQVVVLGKRPAEVVLHLDLEGMTPRPFDQRTNDLHVRIMESLSV